MFSFPFYSIILYSCTIPAFYFYFIQKPINRSSNSFDATYLQCILTLNKLQFVIAIMNLFFKTGNKIETP